MTFRNSLRLTFSIALTCGCLILFSVAGSSAYAESFDWRTVGGQSYVTSVKNQDPAGTCWAFGSTAALEAKYMITRNDTSFAPDLSEQNLVCTGTMGNISGGWEFEALDYFTSTGIVSEAELSYNAQNTSPNWPLQSGWQNRVWKSTSNKNWLGSDTTTLKQDLKLYGPLVTGIIISVAGYTWGFFAGFVLALAVAGIFAISVSGRGGTP